MKIFISIILLFIITKFSNVYADGGICSFIEATIKLENESIRGYFELFDWDVTKEDELVFKNNPGKFTAFVKEKIKGYEPIELYKEVIPFYYPSKYGTFVKHLVPTDSKYDTINPQKIISIQLHSINFCEVGFGVVTPLVKDDKSWINKGLISRGEFVDDLCLYEFLFYASQTSEVKNLVEAFKKEHKVYNESKIEQLVLELKRHKVLVVVACSC